MAARLAALKALLSWKKGRGFVQGNLQKTCENLPQNDRALAYEIALGTCRALDDLDEKLLSLMRKLPEEPCRTILEISLYQLLHTRIPPYAVVNSAVNLARQQGSNEKFANAVLRNALRKNFTKTSVGAPPQWLRVNPQKTTIEELDLHKSKTLFNRFILVPNAGEALKNPLFKKGFYSFQNPASFFVAKMCEGEKIWDACAAPGGKTAMLAEENPNAFFVATDCCEKRIEKLFDLQNRLGLKNVLIALANAQNPPFSACFDTVIVDAPCSNMGVLSRRPEAKHRFSEELPKKQLAILQGASTAVKPGGSIVYSVCSQEKEETSDVIEKFLESNSNFTQADSIFVDMPDVDRFFVAKLVNNCFFILLLCAIIAFGQTFSMEAGASQFLGGLRKEIKTAPYIGGTFELGLSYYTAGYLQGAVSYLQLKNNDDFHGLYQFFGRSGLQTSENVSKFAFVGLGITLAAVRGRGATSEAENYMLASSESEFGWNALLKLSLLKFEKITLGAKFHYDQIWTKPSKSSVLHGGIFAQL